MQKIFFGYTKSMARMCLELEDNFQVVEIDVRFVHEESPLVSGSWSFMDPVKVIIVRCLNEQASKRLPTVRATTLPKENEYM